MRRRMHTLHEAVCEWAARERPDELAGIQPGGELARSKEGFIKLLALCRQWKAETRAKR